MQIARFLITILILFAMYYLSRMAVAWRLKRTVKQIINELQAQGATDPNSAVALRRSELGLAQLLLARNRRRAVQMLVYHEMLGVTEDERYYIKKLP